MSLSKGDLDIVSFNDSEIYDIQKTALLLDTDTNPIFITPIIAYGEELTPGTDGSTLATATQYTIEDQIDTNIGPIVYIGNNTQNVIDILDSDIGSYINSPQVTTSSELSAFFNLETVITGSTSEDDVCVVTDDNGTVTSIYDAVKEGGRRGSWTCPDGGTYNQTYTTTIYTYTGPLYLDEPITVTGTPFTDQNNDTGSIVSTTIPTEYVFIQYSYSETDPALATLNSILTPAGKAALSGTSLDIQVKFLQESTAVSSIPKLITPDSNIIPAINENYQDIVDANTIIKTQQQTIWETGMGYWPSGPIGSTKTDESDITNIINNPEWDTTTYNQLTAKSTITVASTGWGNLERISISRLNLIPVLAKDKIFTQKTVPNPIIPGETVVINVLEPDSQVNLLEATWTQWRYLQGITDTLYGVPTLTATADKFRSDPTATTLIPELTGFNVIEGLNTIYTNVSALSSSLGNINPDLTLNPAFTALSAYSTECCETLTTNVSALSSDLNNISARVSTDFVNLTGDTMTGPLELARDPELDMEAVPRKWLEDNFMPLSNVIPTITAVNKLKLLHSPVEPLDAVSKEYIDCKLYNFEQTFPRIPDLDLRYLNLSGDHMVGALHFSHDTDLDYGVIPSHVKEFDINVSFDNKTFQTIRIYRTDVKHNIKLHDQGNGKVTSLRIINMAEDRVNVTIPPECRCLSTYYDYINKGYSGILSFTSFGTRDCDVYYAHAFECTPREDMSCNEPVCEGGIGMVTFEIPQSECTEMVTFTNTTTTYTIPTSTTDNYCFKIDDSASTQVDGKDYIQGTVNIEGRDIQVGQDIPQQGKPPTDSQCTFIWDIEDVTDGQYKFYFGQENTYIDRNIDDWRYRITYLGQGSFMFNVSGIGPDIPTPTPAPPTYNIEFAFNQLSAVEVDEGRAAIVEVRRLESSETMGACSVDFFTSDDSATESVDYKKTTGTLHWRDDDYSTRIVTIPIYTDIDENEGIDTFRLGLSGDNYTSQKTTIYGMPDITFTYPTPIDIDIRDISVTTLYKMVTGNTANIDTLSGGVDINTVNISTLSGDVDTNTVNISILSANG